MMGCPFVWLLQKAKKLSGFRSFEITSPKLKLSILSPEFLYEFMIRPGAESIVVTRLEEIDPLVGDAVNESVFLGNAP